MEWVRRGLLVAGGSVGRFLYPPICAGCSVAVERSDAVCARCWSRLRFVERPFCEVLGTPFRFDLGQGFLSAEAIADPPPFRRLRSAVLYGDLAGRLVSALKYHDRTDLVPLLAGWMERAGRELLAETDLVVPVPLHRARLLKRRFNQSAELARRLASRSGLPFRPEILLRPRATAAQVGLDGAARRRNLEGAFLVPPARREDLAGKRVLLVDDVFTTGATAEAATRALRRGGAAGVDVLVFARVADALG